MKKPLLFVGAFTFAPICLGAEPKMAWKLREMPIWTFHYREYNGGRHNVWDETYSNWDEVLAWFFSQRKTK